MALSFRRILSTLALAGPLSAQTPIGTLISEQSRSAFTIEGAGARAMGLGGAFIAVADDATAVSFNPAGLAQLLAPEVSFVTRGLHRNVAYQDFETTGRRRVSSVSDALASSTRFDPLFASATAPVRVAGRNLAIQVSIQRVFALGDHDDRALQEVPLSAGTGSPSQLHQSINQSGQVDLYSLAVAYEVSQRILLGVGYNQWRGRWELSSFSQRTSPNRDTTVAFHQSNTLEGGNFNLGLIWRWPTWSLGLVHRTGFHADYTFATELASNLPDLNAVTPSTSTGLHWPSGTGIGLAIRPREPWLITADVTHTLWSTARYMSASPSLDGVSFFDYDRGSRTPDVTTAHLGTEYLWITSTDSVVPLRAGLSREPQPLVDGVTGEQLVIYRVSVGSGFKRGSTGLDIAYRYGWSKRRASQAVEVDQLLSRTPPTSVGFERIHEHRLDLSFIYKFDREPVDRALRTLFVGD
jgi:long-subunit fatty acid transport protein